MARFGVGEYVKFKFVYVIRLRAQKGLLYQDDDGQQLSGKATIMQ